MAEYKITRISIFTDIDEEGRFVKIYRVYFEAYGLKDYVDIPEDKYNTETVKKLIEERIRTHRELLGV